MVEVEGFCFANQCSDILDEFDAQERFGLGWSWGLWLELLSALFTMQVEVDWHHCFLTWMQTYLPYHCCVTFFSFLLYEKVCSYSKFWIYFLVCKKSTKHASKIKKCLRGWKFITHRILSRKVEKINSDHCFAQNLILCGSGPIQEPQKNVAKMTYLCKARNEASNCETGNWIHFSNAIWSYLSYHTISNSLQTLCSFWISIALFCMYLARYNSVSDNFYFSRISFHAFLKSIAKNWHNMHAAFDPEMTSDVGTEWGLQMCK
jgi:hypothetical protein